METKAQWSKTAAKAVLRRKFITIKSYLKKEEKSQKNQLKFHLKQQERGEQQQQKKLN